jgi:hypothetical protein
VGKALLGGIAGKQPRPKLLRGRAEQSHQVHDRVDQPGDGRTEQAERAEWVEPGRHEVVPLRDSMTIARWCSPENQARSHTLVPAWVNI